MSTLDQRTLGLDTRLSVTFTPTNDARAVRAALLCVGALLRLQGIRSAAIAAVGRLRARSRHDRAGEERRRSRHGYTIDPDGAGAAHAFTLDNPDFSEQSLRGNAVFRWEYRPGSVLYFAWTQSRLSDSAFGDSQFTRDRDALFAARPQNIFLVKASWWLPR